MTLWAKLYTDILGDPKLLRAARKGARQLELLPWLIVFAKQCDDDGRLSVNGEAADPEDVAALVPGVTARRVAEAFESLLAIGVLERGADGVLRFPAWEHRSGSKASDRPEAIRERVQRHRATRRNASHETPCNALQVTIGNDPEKEKEKELDQEAESLGARGAPTESRPAVREGDPDGFDACWAAYPKRPNDSRADAVKAYRARLRVGVEPGVLLAGTVRYAKFCEATGKAGGEFVKRAATFYGPGEHYLQPWDVPAVVVGDVRPALSPARALLDALETAGLTHDGLGKDVYGQRLDDVAAQLGRDRAQFRELVRAVKPWTLGRITFPPERLAEFERRLRAAESPAVAA